MKINLCTPLMQDKIDKLRAGDRICLSGVIYTARDAAHARLMELIKKEEPLPIEIKNQIIYYVGPTPARESQIIGSAGPTTSYRMDSFTPSLLELGLKGMIGKGIRNSEVINSMIKNRAIYLGAIGGAGALISQSIISSKIVAYEDLGSEAIRKLEVKDMPLIVVIDSKGNNLYEIGPKRFRSNN